MPARPPIWLNSERFLARRLARPVQRFLDIEASGGLLLLLGTVVALVWANSPWSAVYRDLWHTELAVDVGGRIVAADLRHWVNDALMALFFFVVGLEIKQELVSGHLARARDAMLPAVAALGGMVVPAAIYLAVNHRGGGGDGWGIPMATDIAFALGVLALLGSRVPTQLKVLLLALAIVDDIGAIVVIAVFYSDEIHVRWALAALAGLVLVALLRRLRVWYVPVYAVIGVAVWFATFESGIHATIAGVALGLLTPARPLMPEHDAAAVADELSEDYEVTVTEVRAMSFRLRESVPVAERLQDLLHPWTSYVIIPLFALANAGIELSCDVVRDAATSRVTIGVALGLLVGKLVGITGAVALATRLRLGTLPDGVTFGQVVGLSLLAGIGFTVSLFISGLAFSHPALEAQAKLGVLAVSVLAAVAGSVVLRATLPRRTP
ncbi:MAG TPA: Na+/H+ antiporter NhaA [Acidimicrobiales bacterium]|nr:Na+/H+ antiporter NhaA [Acidimicrobiales bacterium]